MRTHHRTMVSWLWCHMSVFLYLPRVIARYRKKEYKRDKLFDGTGQIRGTFIKSVARIVPWRNEAWTRLTKAPCSVWRFPISCSQYPWFLSFSQQIVCRRDCHAVCAAKYHVACLAGGGRGHGGAGDVPHLERQHAWQRVQGRQGVGRVQSVTQRRLPGDARQEGIVSQSNRQR